MPKLWQIFVKVCTFAQTAGRLEAKPEDEQTKLPCHKCLQNKLIIRRNLLCPSHASCPFSGKGKKATRLPQLPLHMPQFAFVAKSLKSTTYERYKNLHGCHTHTGTHRETCTQRDTHGDRQWD